MENFITFKLINLKSEKSNNKHLKEIYRSVEWTKIEFILNLA